MISEIQIRDSARKILQVANPSRITSVKSGFWKTLNEINEREEEGAYRFVCLGVWDKSG